MKKVLKSAVAIVLCLAMVLSLAACGPRYTNGVNTEEFTDKNTGVTYRGRIKIGAAIARTGAYAGVGEPYGGFYDLFIRYINEELGGVAKGTAEGALGYKLEATTYDDNGAGDQGLLYIQKLIEDDGVFALVGNLGTWNIVAAQEYIVETGVPSVYWGTGSSYQYYNPANGNEKYTFPVQPVYTTEGRIMYLRALQLAEMADSGVQNVSRIGIIHSSTDDGTSGRDGIREQHGLDTSATKPTLEVVQINSQEVTGVATQIAEMADCDVVIMACNQAYFKAAYTAMQNNANTKGKPVITSYVNIAPTNIPDAAVGEGTSNIYGGSWVIIDESATDRQKADFVEFGNICNWGVEKGIITQDTAVSYAISAYAMSSFIALKIFMAGMDRMVDVEITRENFLTAMESGRIDVPISGGVDYSNGLRIGLDGMGFVKYQAPATGTSAATGTFINVKPMQSITEILEGLS